MVFALLLSYTETEQTDAEEVPEVEEGVAERSEVKEGEEKVEMKIVSGRRWRERGKGEEFTLTPITHTYNYMVIH